MCRILGPLNQSLCPGRSFCVVVRVPDGHTCLSSARCAASSPLPLWASVLPLCLVTLSSFTPRSLLPRPPRRPWQRGLRPALPLRPLPLTLTVLPSTPKTALTSTLTPVLAPALTPINCCISSSLSLSLCFLPPSSLLSLHEQCCAPRIPTPQPHLPCLPPVSLPTTAAHCCYCCPLRPPVGFHAPLRAFFHAFLRVFFRATRALLCPPCQPAAR